MTIERARSCFGLFTWRKTMNPGDACFLQERDSLKKEVQKWRIQVLTPDLIIIERARQLYDYLEAEGKRVRSRQIFLTGKKVNYANIRGSSFFGVEDKIIWTPKQ